MRIHFKQRPFFILAALLLSTTACLNNNKNTIQNKIEEIRQEIAPDRRVARFDVELVQAGAQGFILTGETNLMDAKKRLIDELNELNVPVIDSIQVLPSAELNGDHWGIVNISVCNIRSEPKHSAELSTQSLLGTPLRLHKKRGEWYLVQTPDDYFGWLDEGGLVPMNEEEYVHWRNSPKVIYTADFGLAYDNSLHRGAVVSDLSAGNLLLFRSQERGNLVVGFPDGREAYIPDAEAERLDEWLASRQADSTNILQTAQSFMGRPYLWGGTSGKGVDCSGFTKMVFYMNGLMLARDASQQVHTGKLIETDTATLRNLLPGDLLFFGQKASEGQRERIRHVAIYMGDGKVIHATGRVKVQSLRRGDPDFAEDRLKTFIRARRPLERPAEYGIPYLGDLEYYVRDRGISLD
jgi:hypothetical protein